MSAAPQINPDGKILPFSPQALPTLPLERILTELDSLEPSIIGDLESQPEKELLKRWKEASTLGRHEWFLKCAICAATWTQTKAAKRGRGIKDVNQKGLLACVSRRAKKLGLTPSTVYRMAQIFNLVKEVKSQENVMFENNILDILDEQGYWNKALLAAEPVKMAFVFAHKKSTLKRFKVTDAERLVLQPEYSRKGVALKAVDAVREEIGELTSRQALIHHIREAQKIIKTSIIPNCPDIDFKARVWDELLVELDEDYEELFREDASLALKTAWDKGHHREDQLAKATNLPLADVSKYMATLADLSQFIRVQTRNVNERSTYQLWHKVGQPFDNAKLLPMVHRG